jgi:hypothetical protein
LLVGTVYFLISAPLFVAISVAWRALIALEAWGLGAPLTSEELEFLQPSKLLATMKWTYVILAGPTLISAALLAHRAWVRGTFGYLYSTAVAGTVMASYMGIVAFVFRHENISLVNKETSMNSILTAMLVGFLSRALLSMSDWVKAPNR